MLVDAVQYVRPDGREKLIQAEVDDSLDQKVREIQESQCRFTAEVLSSGQVSMYIEHPEWGDFIGEIVDNGPAVLDGWNRLIARFDQAEFSAWLKHQIVL